MTDTANTNTNTSNDFNTLEKRGSNYEKWKKINTDLENGIRVDMNDEKFEEFNGAGGKKAFGSSGFDSCFGVLIAAE